MFSRIVVPVDLAHLNRLDKVLSVSADLAGLYDVPIIYVGVASTVPDEVSRTPEEYAGKLEAFAAAQARAHGIEAMSHPLASADPQGDLNRILRTAIDTLGADLVVMASHAPNWLDWLLASHGGSVAEHSHASVFVVR
ncbi:universal stress protein [Rhodovulum steppense]|uniref:Nucleotide-binding universal stress UspA family protein n=1 Tax=Rhodovulum steppense TaxID=540251 RepID=A0A4R1Z191_9RHOB|nr:universal stress protein [Rhodovulum steppense]TCM87116.1 nucleotide-binding universal stress UspA family protein [Rhodovulum steppense]